MSTPNKKVIPLEACEENELMSIQMKLDKDLTELQTNKAILKSVAATYGQCISCVKSLNLDKFDVATIDTFTEDVSKLVANKVITKEEAEDIKNKVKKKEEDMKKLQKEKDEMTKKEKTEEKKEIKKKSLENSEILVPLTRLIYTPGRVTDTNSFFVRLGTNYYLQRDAKQTIEYYEKKKKKVYREIEKSTLALEEIQKNMAMVDYFIKRKRGLVDNKTQTPVEA